MAMPLRHDLLGPHPVDPPAVEADLALTASGASPVIARSDVVLPAPLVPISADDLALLEPQRHVRASARTLS